MSCVQLINPKPESRIPTPKSRDPKSETRNPKPETLKPVPSTWQGRVWARGQKLGRVWGREGGLCPRAEGLRAEVRDPLVPMSHPQPQTLDTRVPPVGLGVGREGRCPGCMVPLPIQEGYSEQGRMWGRGPCPREGRLCPMLEM